MDYNDKIKALDLQKEKLAIRLERLSKKEKTLKANLKKEERKNEAKRKYTLGGLVFTALEKCGIEEFEDAEILGALIKAFETASKTQRAIFKRSGENILFENRQENIQSAHAQGFSESEVKSEGLGGAMSFGMKYKSEEGFDYESWYLDFEPSDEEKGILEALRTETLFKRLKMRPDLSTVRFEKIEKKGVIGRNETFTHAKESRITLDRDILKDAFISEIYLHELTHQFFLGHGCRFAILYLIFLARSQKIMIREAFESPLFRLYEVQDALKFSKKYLVYELNLQIPCSKSGFDFLELINKAIELNQSRASIEEIAHLLEYENIEIWI